MRHGEAWPQKGRGCCGVGRGGRRERRFRDFNLLKQVEKQENEGKVAKLELELDFFH
ncbi:hypothetical protein Syun_007371 [Stephania yunnanensis]|uniref:Uncharacterized protein n=1 Tax=Stephania yunnanensis TaxID=152371 RepID=A0AAP0KZE3_9MAGN